MNSARRVGPEDGFRRWRKHEEGREDGLKRKNAEPPPQAPHKNELMVYAAAFLLPFTLGFDVAFASLVFSFAANSCLTFAAIASVSTL